MTKSSAPNPHGPLRVGIGGPVGSGKTALMDALCKTLRDHYQIAAITNDIYTKWDADYLVRSGALEAATERLAEMEQFPQANDSGEWRQLVALARASSGRGATPTACWCSSRTPNAARSTRSWT